MDSEKRHGGKAEFMRLKRKNNYSYLLFLLPSLLGVGIFTVIPFGDVLRRSFYNAMVTQFVGFNNYSTVIRNNAFRLAVWNTFKFSVIAIPLLLIVSFLLALLIRDGMNKGKAFKSIFLFPMAVPTASVVLIWKVVFHNQGILNGILVHMGAAGKPWMDSGAAFVILVGSYLWKNLGINIILWLAALNEVEPEVYEAAGVDGAGWFSKLFFITIPCIKPTIGTISILALLNSFKVFREAYLVAGDYPHESIYLLQHVFNNWFRELSLDKLSAGAVISAFIIYLFVIFLQKQWSDKEGES